MTLVQIWVKSLSRPVERKRERSEASPSQLTVVMKPTRIQTPERGAREKRELSYSCVLSYQHLLKDAGLTCVFM